VKLSLVILLLLLPVQVLAFDMDFSLQQGAPQKLLSITNSHVARVLADGGVVYNVKELDRTLRQIKAAGIEFSELVIYSPAWGYKGTATVTKLYEVIDLTGGRDLSQVTGVSQPTLTMEGNRKAIQFDGSNDYLKSSAFTLAQPETVIVGIKQTSWTTSDYLFDGLTVATGALRQRTAGASPELQLAANAAAATNANLAVGSLGVVTAVFNGASSSLRVNSGTAATGNAGALNMGGLTLGAAGNNGGAGNVLVTDLIILKSADATKAASLRGIVMTLNSL
jgi:hypothetical protein